MRAPHCSLVLLLVAAVLILHGLFGPQVAPANLATVLSWVQYRGWLILALLVAGNFFCTGCPFVLVRDQGRRLTAPSRKWPRWLRVKWIGIALFIGVLFTYELFDLWALPRATAWLVLGYFAAALAIDLQFTGATFCKYLCPDRPVQLRRVDDVTARAAGAAAGDVQDVSNG